ncbi:MAG TPA: lasso RiPP family leader peptide-containing protein [Gemmatimonadaceae bacterium]
MYQKPKVERYGTFRELTQVGFNGTSDGYTVSGIGNETCSSITAPGCRTGS